MSEKRIGYLVRQVTLLNQMRLNAMFSEFDLTGSQVFTMIYLFQAREKGLDVNQKDIEQGMEISNPTVSGILNRLENKGLIQRVICKHDARARNIVVTEKALELDKILKEKFQENEAMLVASLSDEETEQLGIYLERILHDV